MVKVFTIFQKLFLLLLVYFMLFKPFGVDWVSLQQFLFQILLNVDKHISSWTWNCLTVENFEFSGVKFEYLYLSTEVVIKDLQFGSEADLLVIKSVPAIINVDICVVMTRLSFYALVDKHSVQVIHARPRWRYLPLGQINLARVLEVMQNFFINSPRVVELESLELNHQDWRQHQKFYA